MLFRSGQEAIATARRLLEAGKSPTMPVIAIENVSRRNERVLRMTLAQMAQGLPDCVGPVLVMMGDALARR